MLASLSIQNVILIDKLVVEFQKGLCALTGETGAGKSILLDSLGLALGARSESGLVRKNSDQASVAAEFVIPKNHSAHEILKNADFESDTSLILRRTISADGRSRAFINDQPVSIALLREIGDTLVEIHGQFDTQGLLDPSTHSALLDQYANIGPEVSKRWSSWKTEEKKLEELRRQSETSRSEESYLRQSLEDLDELSPKEGEEKELSSLRERLKNREQILEGLNAAYHTLTDENDPVRKAQGILARISSKLSGDNEEVIATLERASAEIEAALSIIQSLSNDLEEKNHSLESVDDRLHELRAQARKHNCSIDELVSVREKLAQQLNLIEHSDENVSAQTKIVEKQRKEFIVQAEKDAVQRRKAAEKLDSLVKKELDPLKLGKAKFVTSIEKLPENEWGPGGIDRTRFLVSTNPGSEPGPLNKIASGGEMARFMLALKVVMAEVGEAETLIFDEVDSGIGGAVADAVGERLARLAKKCQVLVVTHSPQVAARAGHHFIVQKKGVKEVKTNITHLPDNETRREEIARMLSGATITKEARAAAEKLLETGT